MSVGVLDLLSIIVLIAAGYLLLVAFYESLSTRDVLVGRLQRRPPHLLASPRSAAAAYMAVVGVLIPGLVLVWTIGLYLAIILVDSIDQVPDAAVVAVAVVGAARVLSYANERASHELAKAAPLALSFLLLTGGSLRLDEKLPRLAERGADMPDWMLLFLVLLELTLRLLNDGSHRLLTERRRRLGLPDDDDAPGVWGTLRALVRPGTHD